MDALRTRDLMERRQKKLHASGQEDPHPLIIGT
jgi:hypothetical protein